jgi:elongation factor P
MLSYSEVTPKKVVLIDGVPHEVLSHWVFRKQQRKPVNQTKLRNLKTGGTIEHTFHQPDKIEEADLEKRTISFIYERNGEYWFMDPKNPKDRFPLSETLVGTTGQYLKQGLVVEALEFDDEIIKLIMPIKVELEVKEAPPDVRGNTAQGGTKVVTLETGATINAPMFIHAGDVIRINTETGTYVERV